MEENMKNRIVPATAREANIDADYIRWISDVKTRYRQSQIKASLLRICIAWLSSIVSIQEKMQFSHKL